MKVDLSCPIELWEYSLPTNEKSACSFTFFNLGERPISSIQITITCFGENDAVLSRRVERPMALEAGGRSPFSVELSTEGLPIDAIDLTIDKAWYEDGDEWRRVQEARLVDYVPNELPPNRKLEQLRYVAGSDAIGYPSDQKNVWICVCGRVNAVEEISCRRCARKKADVFEQYSYEAVQESIDLREHILEEKAKQAREEASRQEFIRQEKSRRKKRNRRTRTTIICALLTLGITSYLFVVLGLPELRYQTAISSMSSGSLENAREQFVGLLDYRDSITMVKECDLRIARANVQSGDERKIDEAILVLHGLGSYPGASELTQEASYEKALLLVQRNELIDAAEMFLAMPGYRDADDRYKETKYQIAVNTLRAGNYDAAGALFIELGMHRDSQAQAKECIYQPAMQLMAAEQYDEAIEKFGQIQGYKDADTQRRQCIYQSALKAQLKKDFSRAAELFTLLGSYSDSTEQMKHSIWLAANEARDSKNYEMAIQLYESIPGYSDADVMAQECVYRPGKAYMAEKDYDQAALFFARIPNYLDAAELYRECIYIPASESMKSGEYASAIEQLTPIKAYKDATKLISDAKYKQAEIMESSGNYEEAVEAFKALGDYSDSAERANKTQYAYAEVAFSVGHYAIASERFAALGTYSDAETRIKECAYEEAMLLLASGDETASNSAYEALFALEDYPPAKEKINEYYYKFAEESMTSGDYASAAATFKYLEDYLDANEMYLECSYQEAIDLKERGEYQEAGEAFNTLGDYQNAKTLRDECYDQWLAESAAKVQELYDKEFYLDVISTLRKLKLDFATLPKAYATLKTMYEDSNLRIGRALIDENRSLEAYGFLMAAGNYKNAKELLDKNIYKLLGTWEAAGGEQYTFYQNGTCVIDGQTLHFNMSNAYGILTGRDADSMVRTHSFTSGGANAISIREDATQKVIKLTRIAPAQVGPDEENEPTDETEEGADPEAGDGSIDPDAIDTDTTGEGTGTEESPGEVDG